jgi:hypothetical protein
MQIYKPDIYWDCKNPTRRNCKISGAYAKTTYEREDLIRETVLKL